MRSNGKSISPKEYIRIKVMRLRPRSCVESTSPQQSTHQVWSFYLSKFQSYSQICIFHRKDQGHKVKSRSWDQGQGHLWKTLHQSSPHTKFEVSIFYSSRAIARSAFFYVRVKVTRSSQGHKVKVNIMCGKHFTPAVHTPSLKFLSFKVQEL